MKIRRGPEVERIINDPPPPSDSEANNEKACKLDDAACAIKQIMKPIDARRQTKHGTSIRPEDLTRNIAEDIIEQFPMVLFRTKSGKAGRRCSNILKQARQEVDLQKELIVEVEINETKVAQEMLQALYLCTGYQDLPQVFVCETFIGGIKELSDFFDKGLITMQLRKYARELGMPHPALKKVQSKEKAKSKFQFKFVRLRKEYKDV